MFRTHPLDLHEIRSIIASSLDRKDLASCARVNQDWNDSFTLPLYKSVVLSKHDLSMESIERNKHLIHCLRILSSACEELSLSQREEMVSNVMAISVLTTLILDKILVGDSGAQEFSEALKINSTLTSLSLWGNSTLDPLNLDGNSIGPNGAQALSDALKINSTLTALDLWGNSIGPNGAQALSDALKINSTLTDLDLGGNSIGPNGVQALSDALKTNSTLSILDLGDNSIEPNGVQALSDALKINSTLTYLSLWGNSIGPNGVQALSDALKTNSTLSILDLGDNSIEPNGVQALSDALKINSTLTSLSLWGNSIGFNGAQALSGALKTNSTLITLDLDGNSIGPNGAQALSDALKINSALTSLSLKRNSVGDIGAQALSDALKTNSTLTALDLDDNAIGPNWAQALSDALKTARRRPLYSQAQAERCSSQAKYALPPERNSLASSSIRLVRLSNPLPIQLTVSGSLPPTKTGRFDCGIGDKKASQRFGCVLTWSIHFSTCIGDITWNLIIPMEFEEGFICKDATNLSPMNRKLPVQCGAVDRFLVPEGEGLDAWGLLASLLQSTLTTLFSFSN
ncbi:RNI-like protein [Linnemannia elongata AG-77]|uniref:RNI-like protein n=1 Tax=Linnemannia elongata AG-77 TaxID=1314771 RepID=A0A197JVU4_9FUNG|nr:RNI-like protein [Linnemannia elongata AG-77]